SPGADTQFRDVHIGLRAWKLGWEKVWRAACWAQLQNTTQFYHILTYAIERNFAENLLSLYYPFIEDPIFQIDANLGYPAAVLVSMFVFIHRIVIHYLRERTGTSPGYALIVRSSGYYTLTITSIRLEFWVDRRCSYQGWYGA
ncbi:unnamed protein product, partial [Rhizoctonia solani]